MASNASMTNLDRAKSKKSINNLNLLLSNEYAIFTKTLNYHWNITGGRFHGIHEFLETQYRDLLEIMDDVAERVRVVGGNAIGTLKEMKSFTTISERPGDYPSISEVLADLSQEHSKIEDQIKNFLKELDDGEDPGTEDFVTGLLVKHEEMNWMLRSHLE